MGYYTFTIPKSNGGTRLITAPDDELKKKQRELLKKLQSEQWISRRAHGFKKYSSCMTNALVHAGKKYIINIDIENFFPSITRRPFTMWSQGRSELGDWLELPYKIYGRDTPETLNMLFYRSCLPQGAPTSPFVSNLYMRRFDTHIQGLLRKYISDDIMYTRYADDMTFSSNSRALKKVIEIVRSKLKKLALTINDTKTRFMSAGHRQTVTGLNINSGQPTIPKAYRRKARAITYRASQGWLITNAQKQRLLGMISHIALCHPKEALKYRMILEPVNTISSGARRFSSVKRIKLKVERGRVNPKQHHKVNKVSQPRQSRKIRGSRYRA